MKILAECDIGKMESFFERLLQEERERMKKYQIAAEDYEKPWNLEIPAGNEKEAENGVGTKQLVPGPVFMKKIKL